VSEPADAGTPPPSGGEAVVALPPDPAPAAESAPATDGAAGSNGSASSNGSDASASSDEAPTGSWRGPVTAVLGLVREVVLVLVIALGLSLLIKTFLVQAFFIPSPSMETTLIRGDRVLVNKLTPGPFSLHRGDVIVFSDPGGWLTPTASTPEGPIRDGIRSTLTFVGLLPSNSDEHLIKRVIGLPGDKVACCDSKGRVTVNGQGIDEPYVFAGDDPSDKTFSVTVPAGHLWVMGDHRSVSQDSRYHPDLDNGMVPISDVVGKAFIKVWPTSRFGLLHNPKSTFATVPAP
jgi:signal peptidase I